MKTAFNPTILSSRRALRLSEHAIAGQAGASFKHEHLGAILADDDATGFFEVHAENYMGAGGPPHHALQRIRREHPVSLHGVCMSIGGPQPLDGSHLQRFRALVERYEPALVCEHLAWSTHDATFFNDLLPLPYTEEALTHVCAHIHEVQETIRRPILLENPSTYVLFRESTISESDFIGAIARRTGCGLLLDVNIVFVSATNHGYSALDYLWDFSLARVGEIPLAGHAEQTDGEGDLLLIDAFHAADAAPLAPDRLASVATDRLASLVFVPHPATRVVRSRYAAITMFSANRGADPVRQIDAGDPEDGLITRAGHDVEIRRLPDGGAIFLIALIEGKTLGDAATAALEAVPAFDLGAGISGMLAAGAFTSAGNAGYGDEL